MSKSKICARVSSAMSPPPSHSPAPVRGADDAPRTLQRCLPQELEVIASPCRTPIIKKKAITKKKGAIRKIKL